MKYIYTLTADCDVPPEESYVQAHGDELDDALEDALAAFLLEAGAGFMIDVSVRVEL